MAQFLRGYDVNRVTTISYFVHDWSLARLRQTAYGHARTATQLTPLWVFYQRFCPTASQLS